VAFEKGLSCEMSSTPENSETQRPLADARGSESRQTQGSLENARGSEGKKRYSDCLAYFITFHTYGTWLRGTERGSVDRTHNVPGTELLPGDEQWERKESKLMKGGSVTLDARQRTAVDQAVREVCLHRKWRLHALHVRTNHVHAVVTAQDEPEKVMNDFKAYATRGLRLAKLVGERQRIWSRHGSTPYLWDEKSVENACRYVIERQGVELPQGSPIENPSRDC
jgi:REP element-mobilizing transposase RayT